VEIAQSWDQRDGMGLSMGVSSVILRRCVDTEQYTAQHLRQNFHLVKPPEVDLKFSKPKQSRTGLRGRPCKCAQLMPN
jgi:hypothetical protein